MDTGNQRLEYQVPPITDVLAPVTTIEERAAAVSYRTIASSLYVGSIFEGRENVNMKIMIEDGEGQGGVGSE